jgi:peptide/nickel transport system substrate-binding protein
MKILLVSVFLIAVLILSIAGCSNAATSTPPTSTIAPTTSTAQTQVPTTSKPPTPTAVQTSAQPTSTQPPTSTVATSAQPKISSAFKLLYAGSITVWDAPTDATSFLDMVLTNIVYDRILNFDNAGNPTPRLAAAYNVSSDGLTVTLPLKKGIKFQDGTELTSKDVKYQVENFTAFGSKMGSTGGFRNVTSVDTPDDYTVIFHMKQPDSGLSSQLALNNGVLNSSTAVKKPVVSSVRAKDHMAGTGPYSFVDLQRDVVFSAARFANYWDTGKPYFNNFQVLFAADPVTSVLALKSGGAQGLYNVSPRDANNLKADGFSIVSSPYTNFVLVPDGSNANSPFSNLKVRQAVEYAIDRKSIASTFGFGYYQPLTQVVGPEVAMGYVPDLQPRNYDVAKAKQLLADAGYPNGFTTSIYCQISDNKDLLTAIQSYLGVVGIKAQLQIADAARYNAEWASQGWTNGLIYRGYGFQMNISENFTNWFRGKPNGSMFVSMYFPSGWDQTSEAIISDANPVTRKDKVQSAMRTIFDQAMIIPVCTGPMLAAFDSSIGGTETFFPVSPHIQCVAGLYQK